MYLSILRLWNFRKYGTGADNAPGLEVHFHEGVNVLIGENDSGKATNKSAMTSTDEEIADSKGLYTC
jgi:predicted ATP-dependent endonuclease of OLD family